MRTFKVYYRTGGKLGMAYVEAKDIQDARFKLMGRFYYASIVNVVEYRRGT